MIFSTGIALILQDLHDARRAKASLTAAHAATGAPLDGVHGPGPEGIAQGGNHLGPGDVLAAADHLAPIGVPGDARRPLGVAGVGEPDPGRPLRPEIRFRPQVQSRADDPGHHDGDGRRGGQTG